MEEWQKQLKYNPIPQLLASGNEAIILFTKRDLLGDSSQRTESLWQLKEAERIVKHQCKEGYWQYPGGNKKIRTQENYNQIETYRDLGYLVEMFGYNNRSTVIQKAANYLLSYQTSEGDIRGIYGNQYTPNYTAGMIELLIKAGYGNDKRVEKVFQWLIAIRQNDGGWAIPLRTRGVKLDAIEMGINTLEPAKSKPFSHLVTGVVLRAFAAHKRYRKSKEAEKSVKLLLTNLFKKDNYPDRGGPEYWLRFTYPFWFTDLISAMDSLTLMGIPRDEPQMKKAINWFIEHQQKNGLWDLKILKNQKYSPNLWFSLAICRIMKRLYSL